MRMDQSQELTVETLINSSSEQEITEILRQYGEEPRSRKIATEIVKSRKNKRLTTTGELKEAVLKAIGYRHGKRHIATRTFQALRIAVNSEMENLVSALSKAHRCVTSGGRIVVISYHSLEDRVVKRIFRAQEDAGLLKAVTKKPLIASRAELEANPGARSAKLRAAEVA